jgi:hypothetical protein
MKVGDLVRPKSQWDENFKKKKHNIGILIDIEKDFYRHNDYFQDRLTIWWFHGETTQEPTAYVEVVR